MRRRLSALLICILIVLSTLACAVGFAEQNQGENVLPNVIAAEEINAQSAILMDAASGDILFAKNEHTRMHPASTTKVMTLLLGLESGFALDKEIAIPQAAANVAQDSTLIPVFPGETMTFGDLLIGFFLNSGNDGANAVAVIVAGSVENFVERMNARAVEIGCTDTHFSNAHGYTAEAHYTTVYDMALIARTAMENADFRRIARLGRTTIHVNERGDLTVGTKRYMQIPTSEYYYADCIGIKSGTTSAAGNCFVGAAERNGATLISVVFKSAEESTRWSDTKRLFEYGWTCYDAYSMAQMYAAARDRFASIIISNADESDPMGGRLDLEIAQISNTNYIQMIERQNPNALQNAVDEFMTHVQVVLPHDLTAPISMGEIIGDFTYYDTASGGTVTAKLVAGRDVAEREEKKSLSDYFPLLKLLDNGLFVALLLVLLVLIILIIALVHSRRAAKQRRRRRIYEQRRAQYQRDSWTRAPQNYPARSSGANRRPQHRSDRRPR